MFRIKKGPPRLPLPRRLGAFLPIATGVALTAVAVDGHAEELDDLMSAPAPLAGNALRVKAKAYFDEFDGDATARSRLLLSPADHAKYIDLRWHLARAIDTRGDLAGLAQYGISPSGSDDGSYRVDLERFPQWRPQYLKMLSVFSPENRVRTIEALRQRGFSDSDVEALRKYLSSHSPESTVAAKTAPLTESFAQKVKDDAVNGRGLDRAGMMAYRYQRRRATAEAYRAWAAGLLDSLDRQRQRVIESYLSETRTVMGIFPSDTEGEVERLESYLLSDDYVRAIEQQFRAGRDWSKAWESSEARE